MPLVTRPNELLRRETTTISAGAVPIRRLRNSNKELLVELKSSLLWTILMMKENWTIFWAWVRLSPLHVPLKINVV